MAYPGRGRATAHAITTNALEVLFRDDSVYNDIGVVHQVPPQVDAAAQAVFTLTRTDKKLIVIYIRGQRFVCMTRTRAHQQSW